MPPIRTFKSAPINPHSASPTTTSPDDAQQEGQQQQDDSNVNIPAWTPATPTAAMNTGGGGAGYPAAKPGAYAMPAPTSSASSSPYITPTKTYPYTPADEKASDSPPAPQPGSRPSPPTLIATATESSKKKTVPPPPKKGEPLQEASYYAPQDTSTQQQQQQQPYVLSTYQAPQYNQSQAQYYQQQQQLPQPSTQPSILDNTFGEGTAAAGQDILNTAKSWMASAGSKLAEAEEEVWKMVNSGSKS